MTFILISQFLLNYKLLSSVAVTIKVSQPTARSQKQWTQGKNPLKKPREKAEGTLRADRQRTRAKDWRISGSCCYSQWVEQSARAAVVVPCSCTAQHSPAPGGHGSDPPVWEWVWSDEDVRRVMLVISPSLFVSLSLSRCNERYLAGETTCDWAPCEAHGPNLTMIWMINKKRCCCQI